MKLFTVIALSLIGISNLHAELELPGYYKVISDVYSETVPAGMCILKGNAIDQNSQEPIVGGIVGETSRVRYTTTDEKGKFKVKLSAKDTTFYFYHENYNEIVCWNYDLKSQHIITVEFVVLQRQVYPGDLDPVAEKPVMYLYSDVEIAAEISLKPKGNFTFTYPAYDDGWNVNVSANGLTVNDVKYPYLFWEGEIQDLEFNSKNGETSGYFINTDSTIQFLESTLTALGLNRTEITDFITFWGPRIKVHNFATIQFLVDEEYHNQVASLNVTPKPDSQLRVYLLFQGTDNPTLTRKFTVPELPKFERQGFTAIEWGGSEFMPVQYKAVLSLLSD